MRKVFVQGQRAQYFLELELRELNQRLKKGVFNLGESVTTLGKTGIALFGRRAVQGGESAALKEGLHHLDPKTIKFSQPNIGTHFSNGKGLSETINDLRSGAVSPHDFPPIQVVQKD